MFSQSKRRITIAGFTLIGVLALAMVVALPALAASCFTDTGGHWAETYVCWLFNNGISSGYPDGSFRPENYITRAEMAVMLQQVAGAGSAGPVANADLLDGIDSSAFAFDGHDHIVTRTNEMAQTIDTDLNTEVLAITLDLPDKCSGIDNWNVLVEATGGLYLPSGTSGAQQFLSIDNPTGWTAATTRLTTLTSGDRVSFATHWLYTNVGSGAHVFRLMARINTGDNYDVTYPVLTTQVLGYGCS